MATKAKTPRQLSGRPSAGRFDFRESAAARGYDYAWQKLRLAFLRENPACVFCDRPAEVVDHIKPIAQGGERLDRENLRPVCRADHDVLTGNLRKTGRNEMPPGYDPRKGVLHEFRDDAGTAGRKGGDGAGR